MSPGSPAQLTREHDDRSLGGRQLGTLLEERRLCGRRGAGIMVVRVELSSLIKRVYHSAPFTACCGDDNRRPRCVAKYLMKIGRLSWEPPSPPH